jgi:hypothetical protein
MAPPCFSGRLVLQGRKHEPGSVARVAALEIERQVAEAVPVRAASPASKRQGWGWQELHQPKASGHGASTDAPAVPPTDYAVTLRAAVERVVMSRTTIEIELAGGMTSDDQNRILIIPWTPPSPHRRREIIQGEGARPSAAPSNRSPRAKAKPNVGSAERSRSLSFAPPSSKRRSTVGCLAASGSSV